jgi:osmotically-inducible protein OsmY
MERGDREDSMVPHALQARFTTQLEKPHKKEMIDMPLDDRVLSALERNPYVGRRSLRFETSEGRVTLRGVVSTYFQKQMAQEALRHVDGIAEIANELEVCWS